MAANLRSYVGYLKIGLKSQFAYKADKFMSVLLTLIGPFISIIVWYVIFSASRSATIAGFNFTDLSAYFLIVAGLNILNTPGFIDVMQGAVKEGSIVNYFTKPARLLPQMFLVGLPEVLVESAIIMLPIVLVAMYLLHASLGTYTVLLFIMEAGMAFVMLQLISGLIGVLAVYTTEIWGIFSIVDWIVYLLGGGLLPISMFPPGIAHVLLVLPFSLVFYLPAATLIGMIPLQESLAYTLLMLGWLAALAAALNFEWKSAVRRISVVGV